MFRTYPLLADSTEGRNKTLKALNLSCSPGCLSFVVIDSLGEKRGTRLESKCSPFCLWFALVLHPVLLLLFGVSRMYLLGSFIPIHVSTRYRNGELRLNVSKSKFRRTILSILYNVGTWTVTVHIVSNSASNFVFGQNLERRSKGKQQRQV
jgi:hypothetical protein